jgi:hypothetical protein
MSMPGNPMIYVNRAFCLTTVRCSTIFCGLGYRSLFARLSPANPAVDGSIRLCTGV